MVCDVSFLLAGLTPMKESITLDRWALSVVAAWWIIQSNILK